MKNAKIAKIAIFLVLATSYAAAGTFDYYRGMDKRVVSSHRRAHHPVINDLFAGNIKQGQPVGQLFNSWPPTRYSMHDDFMTLYYIRGDEETDACCEGYSTVIRIIAMDGKLVKALASEGVLAEIEYVFFNGLDSAKEDKYWTSRLRSLSANK